MNKKCIICNTKLNGQQALYCSNKCSIKSWKVRDREGYLASKKRYRERNKEKINAYSKHLKKLYGINDYEVSKIKKTLLKDAFCIRCGAQENLNIHHVRPLSEGGQNHICNLVTLCFSCHMKWHKIFPKDYWLFIDKETKEILKSTSLQNSAKIQSQ